MSDITKRVDPPAQVEKIPDNLPGQTTIETPMLPTEEEYALQGDDDSPLSFDRAVLDLISSPEIIPEDEVTALMIRELDELGGIEIGRETSVPDHEIGGDTSPSLDAENTMLGTEESGTEFRGTMDIPAEHADSIAEMACPEENISGSAEVEARSSGMDEAGDIAESCAVPSDMEPNAQVGSDQPQVIVEPSTERLDDAQEGRPASSRIARIIADAGGSGEVNAETTGPDGWPDPALFDRPVELISPSLPSACLPPRLEKLAVDFAGSLGVPLTYAVVTLLVCVAALVGCWRRIRVTAGWVEPSTLAGVLVGPPGMLKSHVVDCGVEAMRLIEASEHVAYQAYCKELRAKRDIVAAQEQLYKRAVLEAVAARQLDITPPEVRLSDLQIPRPPALVSTSGTPQGLRDLAARSRTGLIKIPDELPRFLDEHGSPAARAYLMTAYDGRHDSTDLVRGRITAQHVSISLLATVQPAMLPQVIGPDDGLLARYMWVPATRVDAMPRSGRAVPADALQHMFQRIRNLVPEVWGANAPSVETSFEPKAAEVLLETRAFYDARALEREGLVASAFAKAGGLATRLAGAIELASYGLSSRTAPGRICLPSVEAATTLVETVLMPGAESVLGLAEGSIEERDARELWGIIRRHGWTEVSQRDLQRGCSGRLSRADALDKAIAELADRGIVRVRRVMPGPAGGAPRKVIVVNPKAA